MSRVECLQCLMFVELLFWCQHISSFKCSFLGVLMKSFLINHFPYVFPLFGFLQLISFGYLSLFISSYQIINFLLLGRLSFLLFSQFWWSGFVLCLECCCVFFWHDLIYYIVLYYTDQVIIFVVHRFWLYTLFMPLLQVLFSV